jgi:branched-chain amino acid aminotransferase
MKNTLFAGQLPVDRTPTGRIPATTDRRFSTDALPQGMTPTMANPKFVCVNGDMVPHADLTNHVSSIAAKHGANTFEELCVYGGGGEQFLFRVKEHLVRLRNSMHIMQIDCNHYDEDFLDAILMSLEENRIRGDAHIRLTVLITGEGHSEVQGPASLICTANARTSTAIEDKTAHAAISAWRHIEDTIVPPRIRAVANSHNSRFGLLEARRNGYDEPIFLTLEGKVSEGEDSCFAMVQNGVLVTPPVAAAVLESVTRSTLLELAAQDLGLRVQERKIDPTELYVADEAFFCGSGLEIRPVFSVDRFPVGEGRIGPVTRQLWGAYEAVVRGRNKIRAGWLTPV